jgi:predicted GIY-YIG superfamily endonuclease
VISLDPRGPNLPLICFGLPPRHNDPAGWSSLVARQAHNLKVAGSNPAPATNSPPVRAIYRVYVLRNNEGRFYVGLSEDVAGRLEQHNSGESAWTRGRGPWMIVWQSEGLSLTNARRLENRLKRQGRGKGFYSITGLRRPGS